LRFTPLSDQSANPSSAARQRMKPVWYPTSPFVETEDGFCVFSIHTPISDTSQFEMPFFIYLFLQENQIKINETLGSKTRSPMREAGN